MLQQKFKLGDVIEEGKCICGDGIHAAAGAGGPADPSGECISEAAFDQLEAKSAFGLRVFG